MAARKKRETFWSEPIGKVDLQKAAVVVSGTTPNAPSQSIDLGSFVSGTIQVRVVDTDQTAGNRSLDTVFVDQLYFFLEAGPLPTQPPATPTAQAAPV